MKVTVETEEMWLPGNHDVLVATLDAIKPYQTAVALVFDVGKRYFMKNSGGLFVSMGERPIQKMNKFELISYINKSGTAEEVVRDIELAPINQYFRYMSEGLVETLDFIDCVLKGFKVVPFNTKKLTTYGELCQAGTVLTVNGFLFTCVRERGASCLDAYWETDWGYRVTSAAMVRRIAEAHTIDLMGVTGQ